MSDLKSQFEAAIARTKTLPTQSTTVQLDLYGLFKQASSGDVSNARPGMFDMRGRAKWDAWSTRKGLTQEDARTKYVELAKKLGA